MNTNEYKAYEDAVAAFFEREGINCLSRSGYEDTPCFSPYPCDCCKRPLAGNRYRRRGYNPTTEEVHTGYRVCIDCIYYVENGQLDDMTMMDMESVRPIEEQ